jgi:hypothetical protein
MNGLDSIALCGAAESVTLVAVDDEASRICPGGLGSAVQEFCIPAELAERPKARKLPSTHCLTTDQVRIRPAPSNIYLFVHYYHIHRIA